MPEQDDIVNAETHHEKSDVDVRALLWFVVIFIGFAVVSHALLWVMFKQFAKRARLRNTAPLTSVARPVDAGTPIEPRLQPFPTRERSGTMVPPNRSTPEVDMELMRESEEHALRNPAWIDREKGLVRIPIDVAKRLVVQRGMK